LAITNPKVNPGGPSTLKGTNSLTNVDDIVLGSGLSLTTGVGPTLSVDSATLPKAGATQFGVVEFSGSGDLVETAPNSGIGVVKNAAITNPKVNPGGASTLKGTNSLTNVDDIVLGSGLSLTAGVGPTLSVDSATLPKAGATQFGVVEFSGSGDLVETAPNSGIGVVKPLAVTNSKLANLSGVSQLKGSSSVSSAATDITLGSGLAILGTTISVDPSIIDQIPQLKKLASNEVISLPFTTGTTTGRINGLAVDVAPGQRVLLEYHLVLQNSITGRGASVFCLDYNSATDTISGTCCGRVSIANTSIGTFQDYTDSMNTSISNFSYGAAQAYASTTFYQKTVFVDYENGSGSTVSFSISLGKDSVTNGAYDITCFGPASSVKYQYF
jgi:hypothetical protein